ncbi:hypothetical protein ACIO6U_08940 [Streptomyces sp. NPDC087422]|uniref:hypothetical protein n=1 Tax=Streptomyces sp. NPDC087422 TaxID=3365786 RepID=UPI00381DB791
MTVERLMEHAQNLDEAQIQLMCEMSDALLKPHGAWVNHMSDFVSDEFSSSMSNRLKLHHATSEEKFKKAPFEYAFVAAARYSGKKAHKTRSQVHQGADVVVDDTKWSLKTEAAAKMNPENIVISKFSEARWIRDCRTPEDFASEFVSRFMRHLSEYDRVITLRAFSVPNEDKVRYHLVEIPKDFLSLAATLKAENFSERTKGGGSSALVQDHSGIAFRVVLDGSVEKVTLTRIRLDRCVQHAIWTVPTIPDSSQ